MLAAALPLAGHTFALAGPSDDVSATSQLAEGIRQVQEGDFETAVMTLDAAVRGLPTTPAAAPSRAQGWLYLGIAHLALDRREAARESFTRAIAEDATLRLPPERFSPKVIAAFEEARRLARPEPVRPTPSPRGGGAKAAWIAGVGVAAVGGVLLATSGGSAEVSGTASFTNARFDTPVIVCPDGALGLPIPFALVIEARNGTGQAVTLTSASTVVVIESSAIPSEIGFASNAPSQLTPVSLASGAATTVRVESTLTCDNAIGDAPRFNEWSGRVTLSTTAGTFVLAATDRLRVNIP